MNNIVIPHHPTRSFMEQHPNWIFVFGKAIEGEKGNYGQAHDCLTLPNTYGWPVKHTPCMAETAFFKNTQFEIDAVTQLWRLKATHLVQVARLFPTDTIIVLPKLGQGGSQLDKRSPELYRIMHSILGAVTTPYTIDYYAH